jgi:hypothetical protein
MLMMIIQGTVQITIAPMKALTLAIRSNRRRPRRMKAKASVPMNNDAWTRLSRGNTDEKSNPVPYNDVTPVDRPPRKATAISSTAYHNGEICTSANT